MLKYIFFHLSLIFLFSCTPPERDLRPVKEIPSKTTNMKPLGFVKDSADKSYYVILELVENVDVKEIREILEPSITEFKECQITISDVNLPNGRWFKKIYVLKRFSGLDSVNSFYETLPDLSDYAFNSNIISLENYRVILSRQKSLEEYRDFLNLQN